MTRIASSRIINAVHWLWINSSDNQINNLRGCKNLSFLSLLRCKIPNQPFVSIAQNRIARPPEIQSAEKLKKLNEDIKIISVLVNSRKSSLSTRPAIRGFSRQETSRLQKVLQLVNVFSQLFPCVFLRILKSVEGSILCKFFSLFSAQPPIKQSF